MSTDNKHAGVTPARVRKAFADSGRIIAGNIGEQLWITNSYFMVPATHHFRAMLQTYEIAEEPGIWETLGAKTVKSSADPPRLEAVLPADWQVAEKSEEWRPATPRHIEGVAAGIYVNPDNPAIVLAPFPTGANWEYLTVIVGGIDLRVKDDEFLCDYKRTASSQREERRLRLFARKDGKGLKPLVVIVEHKTTASYVAGKREESWAEDFRAILMPVRLSK